MIALRGAGNPTQMHARPMGCWFGLSRPKCNFAFMMDWRLRNDTLDGNWDSGSLWLSPLMVHMLVFVTLLLFSALVFLSVKTCGCLDPSKL